jgi:hypothetical protein
MMMITKLELGAIVNHLSDVEARAVNFYADINASYRLLDDTIVAYTQILGGAGYE